MTQKTSRTLSELMSSRRIASDHFDEMIPFDGQHRSAFETDGDKIGFTEGFRALADKTQVHDRVGQQGNHRNRLTHSVEVSRVGRSLGVALGARMISYHGLNSAPTGEAFWRNDPTEIGHIISAACLAHDIGNPPFGHDGEDAIGGFFRNTQAGRKAVAMTSPQVGAELCLHEGNAQGFRMITRSMGWRTEGGLNLTAATLGAFGKYPFPLIAGQKKYGIHHADLGVMRFVAEATGMQSDQNGGWKRHPLAWLMEAADDICYLTVDLEDAAWIGMIGMEDLCDLYRPIIGDEQVQIGHTMGNTPRAIQYMRSRMIKALINSCVEVYAEIARDIDGDTLATTPAGSGILAHTRHGEAMARIRGFSRDEIYRSSATQAARKDFKAAMTKALEGLTTDLIEHISNGDPQRSPRPGSSLNTLPHARLDVAIPDDPDQAFPWLLDQVTLMSDARVIDLSKTIAAG